MKRILLSLMLVFVVVLPTEAVLKERDLNHTLHVLRLELANKRAQQQVNMRMMEERNHAQHDNLINIMKRCDATSLILYSQGQDFTFDMAYACEQATTLFRELKSRTMPYAEIREYMNVEIGRYDSLINTLRQIPPSLDSSQLSGIEALEHELVLFAPIDSLHLEDEELEHAHHEHDRRHEEEHHHHEPFLLDSIGQADRDACLCYIDSLRSNLLIIMEVIDDDNQHYRDVSARVSKLNDYAQSKYAALQKSIFVNPGQNYFTILRRLPRQINRVKGDIHTKYASLEDEPDHEGRRKAYRSEWRGPVVLFASIFMLFYILVAAIISNVIFRWLVPKRYRTEKYRQKRPLMIMSMALLLFAVAVMTVRQFVVHNLMLMATSLMIQMAWMILAVQVSLLIRLRGEQCKEGARIYTPFILMSVIVICFRIILIPNTLVNIIFPPILLLFTIWQAFTLRRCRHEVPISDKVWCSFSLLAMLAACLMSWIGYTLMAVQLMVWWMFQLAAIATITCCYDLMEMYENHPLLAKLQRETKHEHSDIALLCWMREGYFIDKTWFYDLVNRALVPVCAVFSIVFSIYCSAEIFDLRDLCLHWFTHKFVIESLVTFSVFRLCLVGALFFVFRYLNYVVRATWFHFRRRMKTDFNATLAKNIIALMTWGIYIITVFLMLKVPSSGIAIVTGGLATGMGFASKSLLENFFYGISLMSGRVRVGDYIECDGITGKVESITYQSTQLTTLDGSVVAILNSDLFGKNFKNLTRNHQYELVKIPFGVAYGSNVDEIRRMIIDGVTPLCSKTSDGRFIVNPKNPLKVNFSDFGASSVDLMLVAWVLVDQRIPFTAQAKETIYNVLNAHGIEIPFPQQDVHLMVKHES